MRRTIFILLALLLVMTTCGQTVGNEGQDVTQGTIRVKMETTLGNIVVRLLERPELGGWTEEGLSQFEVAKFTYYILL